MSVVQYGIFTCMLHIIFKAAGMKGGFFLSVLMHSVLKRCTYMLVLLSSFNNTQNVSHYEIGHITV